MMLRFAILVLCLLFAPAARSTDPVGLKVTGFNLEGLSGNENFLGSEVYCNLVGCWIGYWFSSYSLDSFPVVVWNDRTGNLLLKGAWNPAGALAWLGITDGKRVVQTWSERAGPLVPTFKLFDGQADFSHSVAINAPCGISFQCLVPYHGWTSPFSNGGAGTQRASLSAPLLAVQNAPIAEEGARLSVRLHDSFDPEVDPGNYTSTDLFDFYSKVEAVNDAYLYTYTATNLSDAELAFEWPAAGLGGSLASMATASLSIQSDQAPVALRSAASVMFDGQDTGGGLNILRPVPEPVSVLMWLAGLSVLAGRLHARPSGRANGAHRLAAEVGRGQAAQHLGGGGIG